MKHIQVMKCEIIIVSLILAILLGCDRLKKGTVKKKRYEPATIYFMPIAQSNGRNITYTYMPMFDDEDYLLQIEGYNEEHHLKHRWIHIPKEMYDTIKIGDFYCIDTMCHIVDEDAPQNK